MTKGIFMALRATASFARLDKLKHVPREVCFSLPAGRQPGQRASFARLDKLKHVPLGVRLLVSVSFFARLNAHG